MDGTMLPDSFLPPAQLTMKHPYVDFPCHSPTKDSHSMLIVLQVHYILEYVLVYICIYVHIYIYVCVCVFYIYYNISYISYIYYTYRYATHTYHTLHDTITWLHVRSSRSLAALQWAVAGCMLPARGAARQRRCRALSMRTGIAVGILWLKCGGKCVCV